MNQALPSEELLQTIDKLWTGSYHGVLSTQSVKFEGYPFGSLLPICRDDQGNPLMMISHLAQHTRNLDSNPHCSLTLIEQNHAEVLQWTRLTCLADAQPATSSNAMERYCRYYPDGRRYHKELNFSLYRLMPRQFYLIAGFGSARWFDVNRVLDMPRFQTAAEMEILYQLNAREHDLLNRFLSSRGISGQGAAHAVGANPRGFDIRQGETLTRYNLPNPVNNEIDFIPELERAIENG
jgi:heme iron utilization protein